MTDKRNGNAAKNYRQAGSKPPKLSFHTYFAALIFAVAALVAAAVCLIMGMEAREAEESLLVLFKGSPSSEISTYYFASSMALVVVAAAFYLFAPFGIRIDAQLRAIVRFRGLCPELFKRLVPFAEVKRVLLVPHIYHGKGGKHDRYLNWDLKLELHDDSMLLRREVLITKLRPQLREIAEIIRVPAYEAPPPEA
jgi:hypothetical protein